MRCRRMTHDTIFIENPYDFRGHPLDFIENPYDFS